MFYTHAEASRRVGYWFLMNGTAQIFSGLVAYGTYHIDAEKFAPWRAFMIICAGLTLIMAVVFYFFVPDSPITARFLTEEDKAIAINRLSQHSSGIENKHWKKEQFIEALKDWKVWAVSVKTSARANVSSSSLAPSRSSPTLLPTRTLSLSVCFRKDSPLTFQESFGFTVGQTTLLGTVGGAIEILTIISSSTFLRLKPNWRGYIGALYYVFR